VKSKGKGEQVIEGPTKTGRQRSASLDLRLVRDESLMFAGLEGGYLNPG